MVNYKNGGVKMRTTIKLNKMEDVKLLLDLLKPANQNIDLFYDEDTFEYEEACEAIAEYFYEIEEFLIGGEELNSRNLCNVDIRMMAYWDYLKEEIDFNELKDILREHSSKRNIEF